MLQFVNDDMFRVQTTYTFIKDGQRKRGKRYLDIKVICSFCWVMHCLVVESVAPVPSFCSKLGHLKCFVRLPTKLHWRPGTSQVLQVQALLWTWCNLQVLKWWMKSLRHYSTGTGRFQSSSTWYTVHTQWRTWRYEQVRVAVPRQPPSCVTEQQACE